MWIPVAMTICLAAPSDGAVSCETVTNLPPIEMPTKHVCEGLLRDAIVMELGKASSEGAVIALVSLSPECREKLERPA